MIPNLIASWYKNNAPSASDMMFYIGQRDGDGEYYIDYVFRSQMERAERLPQFIRWLEEDESPTLGENRGPLGFSIERR